jgi:hypothetical protein
MTFISPKKCVTLFFFPFFFPYIPLISTNTNAHNFEIGEIESSYSQLVSKILEEYRKRCSVPCVPSYHSCGLIFPNMTCNFDFNLSSCNCAELNRSLGSPLNSSTTTVTLNIDLTVFMSDIPQYQDVAEMICSTEFLKEEFKNLSQKFKTSKWHYFGSWNGIMRIFPAQELCHEYDPRLRPWYISATTGFKKMVLFMDLSQSMNFNGKIGFLKNLMKDLVDSLGFYDWIGVVAYGSFAFTFKEQLLRMTIENKAKIKDFIDNLEAKGLSNYEDAFRKAFNMLNNSNRDSYSDLPCKTYFLFFSDGKPTLGESNPTKLLSIIHQLQLKTSKKVSLSTFNIMKPNADDILLQLSCGGNGFYYRIKKTSEFKQAMSQFFSDMTSQSIQKGPIWSEPYLDELGLGWITTLTFPVYSSKKLLGVLGVDFKIETFDYLKKEGYNLLSFLLARNENILQNCSEQTKINDPCNLEAKRSLKCSERNFSIYFECSTPEYEEIDEICNNFTANQIFYGSAKKRKPDFSECCEPCSLANDAKDYTEFYYIGGVIGLLACVISIFIVRWIRKKKLLKTMKRRRTFLKSFIKTT